MNVEEFKHEARSLEQQGETEAALELYEKILSELEGTPEIWRELPLYVKAGDLSLKLNDSSNAISHYEKAANAYAAYGSSKSVIALCIKILRVNPGRTHVFLRLVRLMIEREHLAEARLVLLEYAGRLKLPKAGLVLEGLADAPDEQMKPLLDMLLELGGRYEYARAQSRDHASEEEAGEEQPVEENATAVEEDVAPTDSDAEATLSLADAEQFERDSHTQTEEDEAEESADEAGMGAESDAEAAEIQPNEEVSTSEAASPEEGDVHWVEERQSAYVTAPRSSRQVLFREADQRKSKPMALWIGLGAAAVVVVGGLSLVLFGAIPLGNGDGASRGGVQPVPIAPPSDSASMAGVELEDSLGTDDDSLAGETELAPSFGGERTENEVVDSGSTAVNVDSPQSENPALPDSLAGGQTEATADTAIEDTMLVTPPSQGVMVQDFDIESNTEFVADGRVGYRVSQILGTGELLVLSAVYFGEDIASAPGSEEMTLAPLVGDTTTAIIHFNRYAVEARAVVSASVLATLLGRLIEVPRSN